MLGLNIYKQIYTDVHYTIKNLNNYKNELLIRIINIFFHFHIGS